MYQQKTIQFDTGAQVHDVIVNYENGKVLNFVFKPALHGADMKSMAKFADNFQACVGEIENEEIERLEKIEAERIAAEKAEAEKVAVEKAEAERIAAEKAEAEKAEAEKVAVEKVEVENTSGDNEPTGQSA